MTGLRQNGAMTVSYDVEGAGPPVLLLRPAGVDGRMWGPLVERLRDSFRLVVPDLRGHGLTPLPGGPLSHVDDVRAVLDGLGLERAAVVGASLGGQVGLALATLAPERAAGVPGARRAEVADAGHLIALERPDAAAELVRGLPATVPA